ncbi:hypothetical protein DL96DRAFT_1716975 [Flagelloscypha sp. PMI_526]|nr:hypothetical protein DL96DRAFT_1716975 [Flagelloscypha sp. PMI_526]
MAAYLDEAEIYDHDMIQGFRDTIDSLLVLAGLFSAIVATFCRSNQPVSQTRLRSVEHTRPNSADGAPSYSGEYNRNEQCPFIQHLQGYLNSFPHRDYSIVGRSRQTMVPCKLLPQFHKDPSLTRPYAYVSVTPGSSRDMLLTHQCFDGLVKWKLREIVGSLPLLLHLAFAVFFAGLSYFVYDLHTMLSSIVIICVIVADFLYFGSILLPALWLECPYRVPLLFRPARSLIYFIGQHSNLLGPKAPSISLSSPAIYLPGGRKSERF